MHLVRPLLVVALVTPLAVSTPAGSRFFRRTGDDGGSSSSSISASVTLSDSSSVATPSKDQSSSSTPLKDLPSITASLLGIPDKITSTSTSDKDTASSTSVSSKDDKTSSFLPAKDQLSSSVVALSNATGILSPPESTQEVVTTEVVYTTLTTCPVTSTVISGTKATEEVTMVVSTVTRTSTSTICTKCVAPPKSKSELPSSSAGESQTSSLPSVIIFSLTQPATGFTTPKPSTSSKTGQTETEGAPYIVYSLTLPSAPSFASAAPKTSSQPELLIGTAATFSQNNAFHTFSLTVSAISIPSIPGYGIVPSPSSIPGGPGPFANATSTVTPVFSAGLLGNAYGGGFVKTASLFVTKLQFPNGPTEGVPPGYVSTSKDEASATISISLSPTPIGSFNNSSQLTVGFPPEIISAATFAFVSTEPGSPALSATIAKNATNISGFDVVGPATTTISEAAGSSLESQVNNNLGSVLASTPFDTVNTPSPFINGSSGETEASAVLIVTPNAISASPVSSGVAALTGTTEIGVQISLPAAVAGAQSTTLITFAGLQEGSGVLGTTSTAVETATSASHNALITLPAEGRLVPLASQTLVEIGAFGSPVSSPGENQAAPIALAAQSPNTQIPASAQPAATVLSPVIGANDVTSFAQTSAPTQPAYATILTPVVGANGVTSLVAAPAQSVASALQPVVGANGMVTVAPAPFQPTTTNLTPVVGANGVTSPVAVPAQSVAPALTPIIGANGVTTFAQVSAPIQPTSTILTPIVGTNGVTSLVAAPAQSIAPALTPVVGANGVTFLVPAPAQYAATFFTPVVGANGVTSLAQAQPAATAATPIVGANGAASLAGYLSPLEQALASAQAAATVLAPVVGANGVTSLAVIPTPVIGANGLTSLAIFSTPIAAANGVTPPAVILTPVVGANGLTSLAVLATPVVGANGLTSLAIGLGSVQTAIQPNGVPSPIEGSVLVPGQAGPSTPPVVVPSGATGINVPSGLSPNSGGGSGANSSVYVPLIPTQVAEFQGSAVRLSLGFGAALVGMLVLLVLL